MILNLSNNGHQLVDLENLSHLLFPAFLSVLLWSHRLDDYREDRKAAVHICLCVISDQRPPLVTKSHPVSTPIFSTKEIRAYPRLA